MAGKAPLRTSNEVGHIGVKVLQQPLDGIWEENSVVIHVQQPLVGVAEVLVGQEGNQRSTCVTWVLRPAASIRWGLTPT